MSGTTYYTIEEHLLSMYEQTGRKMGLAAQNRTEYESWKKQVRATLTALAGIS